MSISILKSCPVGWGCRIHWLLPCRGVRLPQRVFWIWQSDREVLVMLELWGMRSTPSLPSLQGPLWLGVVALDRALFMGQIELNCVLILNWIVWNRTVYFNKNGLITHNGWCTIKLKQTIWERWRNKKFCVQQNSETYQIFFLLKTFFDAPLCRVHISVSIESSSNINQNYFILTFRLLSSPLPWQHRLMELHDILLNHSLTGS